MADERCIVVNPTAVAFTNINTEGENVPAYSVLESVNPVSDAEQGVITAANGAVMAITGTTDEIRRLAGKLLRLGRDPGSSTAQQ